MPVCFLISLTCMHIHMHTCTHARTHAHTHTHTHACTHTPHIQQTGTAVYLESIPPPSQITIEDRVTSSSPHHLTELQTALNSAQDENRRKYDLELPVVVCVCVCLGYMRKKGSVGYLSILPQVCQTKMSFSYACMIPLS